jgi:ribosomal protein L32
MRKGDIASDLGPSGDKEERSSTPRTKLCPLCGTIIAANFLVCTKCGVPLQKLPDKKSIDGRRCPSCGAFISGETLCPQCGWRLRKAADDPLKSKIRIGVILHDVTVGGVIAFHKDEYVKVEEESPDPERPEYKYVALSKELNKRFRLSNKELGL